MIQRDHPDLSISQQCKLVRLSRSAFYYAPVGVSVEDLAMMKRLDEAFTKYPFFGSRQLSAYLTNKSTPVGRHRVRRLMAKMGLEAITKHGPPEIMNTDQGSQFTGAAWITTLTQAGVRISIDGRGRYLDNIFIKRLWRSFKQEAIYLEEITDGFQARSVIKNWITFYNTERPHSALGHKTPDEASWAGEKEKLAA